ncbi:MAG: Rieske 2Fe-2S domain-containing protein, partial [Pirellulaceae bacterium]|nr:Rieske 2Fe-2S domain-containing protein [Pirellulaceae bacterium]
CTHGRACLPEGLLKGNIVECPKHNGRFDIRDGTPQRAPIRVPLKTYSVKVENETVLLNLSP